MSRDNDPIPAYIVAWAREPGPRRVLADAFARFQRGQALSSGACRMGLSEEERRQVGRILPADWVATGLDVTWRGLRAGLAANDTTLEAVVGHLRGPWRNLLQERRVLQRENQQDHEQAVHTLDVALAARLSSPALPDAVLEWLGRGLFGRRTNASDVELIQRTLAGLPADGGTVGLAVLAARVFGDAHALDRTTALGRAVARFLRLETALRSGEPIPESTDSSTPQGWRAAWAAVGVVCDQVSSQVLVLNLPLEGDAPAVAIANAAVGEPVWLTLRAMAGRMSVPSDVPTVFVCENPSIVEAAADALGATSQPLICAFGRPSAAVLQLLRAVGSHTEIKVQADADVTGRAIVASLVAELPTATPWRMPETGVAYEEELVDELLTDLRRSSGRAR